MTIVVGVDPSTKHLAMVSRANGEGHPFHAVKHMIANGKEPMSPDVCANALVACRDFLDDVLSAGGADFDKLAYIEAPLVGRGGVTTTMKQSMVSGVIQACFVEFGFKTYLVNVQTWKKDVAGSGHADKDAVADMAGRLWAGTGSGRTPTDQDILDAVAICRYGEITADRGRRILEK